VKRREQRINNQKLRVGVPMPYLVRDHLFFGNIGDAAAVLSGGSGDGQPITYVLSLLSSASISFFSEWRPSISIPTEEIERVHVAGDESPKKSLARDKLLYLKEHAGPDLKLLRMAVPLKDTEDENLLDYLEVCLNFIEEGRRAGSVLVHCFAGVSRRLIEIDFVHSKLHIQYFVPSNYEFLSISSFIAVPQLSQLIL
jgi:dual specificity phosphatase 12